MQPDATAKCVPNCAPSSSPRSTRPWHGWCGWHGTSARPPPGIDAALVLTRRVFVQGFPFSLYFVELPTRYRVLAVDHARRRPFYWRNRR